MCARDHGLYEGEFSSLDYVKEERRISGSIFLSIKVTIPGTHGTKEKPLPDESKAMSGRCRRDIRPLIWT